MEKSRNNVLNYTVASHASKPESRIQTPEASLLQLQGNAEGQSSIVFTSSQVNDPSLLFSSRHSQVQDAAIAQALQVLKIYAKPAEDGITFALLNDKEISEKLSSMNEQIQSLSSTVCIMADDIFAKSTLINKLMEQLERSESALVKLSTTQFSTQVSYSQDGTDTEAVERNDMTHATNTNQAVSGPMIPINEPSRTVHSAAIDQLNVPLEPEPLHYCYQNQSWADTLSNELLRPQVDLTAEIAGLRSSLAMKDKLINALIALSNEKTLLLNILLDDEDNYSYPSKVDQFPEIGQFLDTIKAAGALAGGDASLRQRVKAKLKELQELRLTVELMDKSKQEPDNSGKDHLLTFVQKATESLSNLEKAFCYFVILGVLIFLFSQWVTNPWKYS